METEKQPRWILTDDWAVDIDSLNWKLKKRSYNAKTGKPTKWKVVGYYQSLNQLADSLTDKVMLHDTEANDIVTHVIRAVSAVECVLEALKDQMGAMDGVGLETMPAGYRRYMT